jgi:DNA-binding ferritin-like protein (Dps family)
MAIKLFEQLKLQEQQVQNVMGAHMIHANLMHCFLWAKQWPELLEEVEKYRRLVKSKGQLSDILMRITDFSELIAKQMLGETSLSGPELWANCKELLADHPKWFEDMVPYVFDQLGFDKDGA